ncbi:hypothetical protein MMC29_005357, partial [Sticta canariensis]|nr:hypothetical protein [Sticta canariensis]
MLFNVLVLAALSGAIAAPLPQYDAGSASTPLDGSLIGVDLAGASSFPDIQSLQPGVLLAQTSDPEDLISTPKKILPPSEEQRERLRQHAADNWAKTQQQIADRKENPQGPAADQSNTPSEFTTTKPSWEQDFQTGLGTVLGATGVTALAGVGWNLINGVWTWIQTDDAASGGQGFGIPFFSNG